MNETGVVRAAIHFENAGRVVFAATMLGFGVQGFVRRDFAQVWQPVPAGLPGRTVLIFVCALVAVGTGVGLLWRRTATGAARLLFLFLLAWLLLLRLPLLFVSFTVNVWYSACETAVIVAAAWVLFVRGASDRDRRRFGFAAGELGVRVARWLYGVALIPFGLAHFLYLQATAPLVPAWLPAPVAWAYATGAAFIVAGLAILVGVLARWATVLSALQMGAFTLLVWVPIVVSGAANPGQWGEFVVSWALTVAGLVVASSYWARREIAA